MKKLSGLQQYTEHDDTKETPWNGYEVKHEAPVVQYALQNAQHEMNLAPK